MPKTQTSPITAATPGNVWTLTVVASSPGPGAVAGLYIGVDGYTSGDIVFYLQYDYDGAGNSAWETVQVDGGVIQIIPFSAPAGSKQIASIVSNGSTYTINAGGTQTPDTVIPIPTSGNYGKYQPPGSGICYSVTLS